MVRRWREMTVCPVAELEHEASGASDGIEVSLVVVGDGVVVAGCRVVEDVPDDYASPATS